jgi:abnormal spindle-like microcephaly-associated protein
VSIASTYDDTTDTIDFTRAVKIPPRRRSTVFGANARRAAIGNDLEIVEESCEPASSGGPKGTGKTLLSKPAMRSRRMLGGGGSGNVQSREVMFQASRSFAPRAMEYTERSKVKEVFVTEVEQPSAPRMEIAANRVRSVKVEGGARRRTIFVPSDDTTMLTIHPGANTTSRFKIPTFSDAGRMIDPLL